MAKAISLETRKWKKIKFIEREFLDYWLSHERGFRRRSKGEETKYLFFFLIIKIFLKNFNFFIRFKIETKKCLVVVGKGGGPRGDKIFIGTK